ncbi:NFX1-type zinc finger-containing protein 1 [Operophtera brumata]|uniref:NFX1-type zinc finger-containing protein 1 n=1 Tax=Operophtera brumata TaxID=104452 RepID=A0A0L7L9L9_OPEBR|nr:NFX1-type zinc finger-containing protein 1 [Operophtera brumata]
MKKEDMSSFWIPSGKPTKAHIPDSVFRNVKFVRPYVSQTKVGSMVQIDVQSNKMFKRTNWKHNKRFIFGSLVLFTKDNCKTFIAATILDREEGYLARGMIPVSIIGQGFNAQLYHDDTYTMIESEVYFEPYYHVLKVLQDPAFPQHIAMKQYIVDVNVSTYISRRSSLSFNAQLYNDDTYTMIESEVYFEPYYHVLKPQPKPPSYVAANTEFAVETVGTTREIPAYDNLYQTVRDILEHENDDGDVKFTVLQDETWPKKDALSFNDSQYDAFKLSLTHEFAVVQGPPGTGKTYLGIKVAKTLFENLKEIKGCLMLVICYTNHALDQFLEALMDITDSIVRIGGQSRNPAMEQININKLRRNISIHSAANHAFFDQKLTLQDTISEFKESLLMLDVLLNGVIRSKVIADEVRELRYLCDFYKEAGLNSSYDPLFHWLFEHNNEYYEYDVDHLFEENTTDNSFANLEKENRRRTGVVLDEQDNNSFENMAKRREISSFSVEAATDQIKQLIAQYNNTANEQIHRNITLELQLLNSYKTMFIERVNTATTIYEESRMMLDLQVLKDRRIVGMTTMIVEEAAEVLEQHIVTSLTEGCKHLILIGDYQQLIPSASHMKLTKHFQLEVSLFERMINNVTLFYQQLRPSASHMKLAKHFQLGVSLFERMINNVTLFYQQLRPSASHMKLAKHFQLEVSLFERMINNGIHSRRLSVQHRMRPEIAALICPHIYPELENHPSVYDFPDVKGMTKNLEADLTLALANYLMQQGYRADDESDKYTHLNGVKITVVDNYQGEESKIILLSLVRNNEENKIGFLGTANRICVALSRAKHGFYIFGNIDTLKASSELWQNIATTLETNTSLGTNLILQCQTHRNNMTIENLLDLIVTVVTIQYMQKTKNVTFRAKPRPWIEKLEDFEKVPEGGCLLPCDVHLPKCGHKCLLLCHGYDREHLTVATKCTLKCER